MVALSDTHFGCGYLQGLFGWRSLTARKVDPVIELGRVREWAMKMLSRLTISDLTALLWPAIDLRSQVPFEDPEQRIYRCAS